ncbi:MAG TPA: LamG domain-containing protein, partial [Burkholderiales bacterium]|nr:LamG domain-containing protein [Burkholderiales bacterium]
MTAAALAQARASRLQPVHLMEVYFDAPTGTLYLSDFPRPIVYGGNTYLGAGYLLGVSAVQETTEAVIHTLSATFSGVDQTWIANVLTEKFMDRRLVLRRGFVRGDAFFLDSSNRASVTNNADFDLRNAFTVELVVKPENDTTQGFIDKTISGATNNQFWIGIESTYKVRVKQTTLKETSGGTPAYGTWQRIAGTYDGANLRFFVDNAQIGSPLAVTAPIDGGNGALLLGGLGGTPTYNASGYCRDFRVFNRALSATELHDYRVTDGLMGWWPAAEGGGLTLYDHSGRANHATMASGVVRWE